MPVTVKWGIDTPMTTVDWLWKPFIPYGKVSIIQGDGGEGKTTLILKIAAMLSQGIKPPTMKYGRLGQTEQIEPVTIFYASTEEEIADSALPTFTLNGGNKARFAYSGEKTNHMNLDEEDIRSVIEQTGAKLIIIDPLQAFLPHGVTLNNVSRMRPIFTALSNVALETGAAIVLLGHMNKNEHAKDIHRGLGSADISAAVRSIILVSKDKEDPELRVIRTIKSNFRECDYTPIGARMNEHEELYFVEIDEEEESHSPINIAMDFLRDVLQAGPIESNEMMEMLEANDIKKRTADRAKKELGIISRRMDGKSYWCLE